MTGFSLVRNMTDLEEITCSPCTRSPQIPQSAENEESGQSAESGEITIEYALVSLGILVPLIYLIVAVFTVQSAVFAVDSAANIAARTLQTIPREAALPYARAAAALALEDQGFTLVELDFDCETGTCPGPDARAHITVRTEIPMPLLPDFLSGAWQANLSVSGHRPVHWGHYVQG